MANDFLKEFIIALSLGIAAYIVIRYALNWFGISIYAIKNNDKNLFIRFGVSIMGILMLTLGIFIIIINFLPRQNAKTYTNSKTKNIITGSFDKNRLKSDEEWKKILTPEEFHILREKGTDIPFTKEMTNNHEKGTYVSVGCNQPVFRSETKFDSGTGWPSFYAPINEDALVLKEDYELGYKRIEVLDKCGGHLGHVFDDGPKPTGLRYCINATALKFIPD